MKQNPYNCSCGWTHWRPDINVKRELITKRFAYSIDYNIIFMCQQGIRLPDPALAAIVSNRVRCF